MLAFMRRLMCLMIVFTTTVFFTAINAEESPSTSVRQVLAVLPPGLTPRVLAAVDEAAARVDTDTVALTVIVPVVGQVFQTARRVVVREGVNPAYRVQAYGKSLGDAAIGDVLLVSFWIRAPEAAGGAT